MFAINDAAKAKKTARALEKFLKKQGLALAHGQGLNAVAAMAGFEDWNGLNAQLSGAAVDAFIPKIWDVDFEKVRVINVFGSDYAVNELNDLDRVEDWLANWDSAENPFRGKNPIALRLESQNEDSYGSQVLRVKELLSFKWDAKQQCFVSPERGRMFLFELAPYQFKPVAKEVPAAEASEAAIPRIVERDVVSVLDVDFSRVTGLKRGGDGFWVDARHYPEALAWLDDWNNPANENDPDVPVLELTYIDDDGFTAHEQVLADELLALKWAPSRGAFVSPTGVEYEFTCEVPVISGVQPKAAPVVAETEAEALGNPPTRYIVDVYSLRSDEETCSGREHVGAWEGAAFSRAEAEEKALAKVWDDAMFDHAAEPSCDVNFVDDEEDGPFSVLIADGQSLLNAYRSFTEAWSMAAKLSKQYGAVRDVQVVDVEWNSLYTFKKQ